MGMIFVISPLQTLIMLGKITEIDNEQDENLVNFQQDGAPTYF